MKRYALLRLIHGANKVVMECQAASIKDAADIFRPCITNFPPLDADGYAKQGDVSLCVAEFFDPLQSCYRRK